MGPSRRRYLLLAVSAVAFLPPLALIPQLFGESDLCGRWCPRMALRLPPVTRILVTTHMGVALVAVALLVTFFFGRYFCSHVCPIGGSTELGSMALPRKAKLSFARLHAPSIRYAYLLVFLLAPVLGVGSLCCRYCNFAAVPRLLAAVLEPAAQAYLLTTTGLVSVGLVVLLGIFARGGRAYCNFMCPIGAIDSLVNVAGDRLGMKRVRVDTSQCNGCGLCEDVCPVWAIQRDGARAVRISQFSCMPCGKCQDACPTGAIRNARR